MTEQRDDDALSWAGDDDPTLDPSGVRDLGAPADEAPKELILERPQATEPAPIAEQPKAAESITPQPTATAQRSSVTSAGALPSTASKRAKASVGTEPLPEHEQMSSAMLVTLGIFGGIFLLYSVGWLISAFRPDAAVPSDTVGEFMFNLGQGLAVAAGPVWMAATLWLTRDSKPSIRIAMLALGVLLVLPWPFLRGV